MYHLTLIYVTHALVNQKQAMALLQYTNTNNHMYFGNTRVIFGFVKDSLFASSVKVQETSF